MLNITRGKINKPVASKKLEEIISSLKIAGELYFGYPLFGSYEEQINLEAIFISKEYGLIIFDVDEGEKLVDKEDLQDNLYNKFEAKLKDYKELNLKRKLMVDINVITFAPLGVKEENSDFVLVKNCKELADFLENIKWDSSEYYSALVANIQAVTTIKNISKRLKLTKTDSKGAKLKNLENSIANLDNQQNRAIVETVEGPQRIRGLAGSGKTIVLALKIAYLHCQNPEWTIAITYSTRSLRNQFIDLIRKFTYEHKKQEPDWTKVKIINAWGSPSTEGIYYNICKNNNIKYMDYSEAKIKYGQSNEFKGVCSDALAEIKEYKKLYDVILIDEAQDFSEEFLMLCYNILENPKRLIWAYDELQNLNNTLMKSPEEIFGKKEDGEARVQLRNSDTEAKEDIILRTCYRNSKKILTLAHALGFGIYKKEGLVQMFNDIDLWSDIGYTSNIGIITLGKEVELERTIESSPKFLEMHSKDEDLIISKKFETRREQAEWIAKEIEKNLTEDELEYKDIIVIHCNPQKTQSDSALLRNILFEKKINSHLVGVTTSKDSFFEEDSITITGIYRAKGNEAAMVYIFDADYCYEGIELIKKRNILFTAITRSKAWVRITGCELNMTFLNSEIEEVRNNDYKLKFIYPTEPEMERMKRIHKDRTSDEKEMIAKSQEYARELKEAIRKGLIDPDYIKQLFNGEE